MIIKTFQLTYIMYIHMSPNLHESLRTAIIQYA